MDIKEAMDIPPKPKGPPPMPENLDQLLAEAIEKAFSEGKSWSNEAERQEYLNKIGADDFLPPIFCETTEEIEKSGMSDALNALLYEGEDPGSVMLDFKKKGNDAFANGKRNVKKNVQYYRDAINFYHEAIGWCDKIKIKDGDDDEEEEEIPEFTNSEANEETEEITYTKQELSEIKSTLYSNISLAHIQLKNYGYSRNIAQKAIDHNPSNIKAWYRLAKSQQMLKNYIQCGDAITSGLKIDSENAELRKLSSLLSNKIQIAKNELKRKQRHRMERITNIKRIWNHCNKFNIKLGRVPLLSLNDVKDLEDDEDVNTDAQETTWKYHYPFSGKLPKHDKEMNEWAWPVLLIYPTHSQCDFIESMSESEMIALRLAQMFPEVEDDNHENALSWDYNNEFICSNLEIYCEIHQPEQSNNHHPESIQIIQNQLACIKFYECCRAIQGDDGPDMVDIVTTLERKRLSILRDEYLKKENKKFAGYLPPCNLLRIHPAVTLYDVLKDSRVIVPNVSFFVSVLS